MKTTLFWNNPWLIWTRVDRQALRKDISLHQVCRVGERGSRVPRDVFYVIVSVDTRNYLFEQLLVDTETIAFIRLLAARSR